MNSADAHGAISLPHLTADLPGVGGVIKQYDEEFVVEELPLYEASGTGTHVYFTIEKRGLPTLAAVKIIAEGLGKLRLAVWRAVPQVEGPYSGPYVFWIAQRTTSLGPHRGPHEEG